MRSPSRAPSQCLWPVLAAVLVLAPVQAAPQADRVPDEAVAGEAAAASQQPEPEAEAEQQGGQRERPGGALAEIAETTEMVEMVEMVEMAKIVRGLAAAGRRGGGLHVWSIPARP